MDRLERVKAIVQQYANKGKILLEESYAKGEHASTTGYWDGYADCAKTLLREIDSMQEEPKEFKPVRKKQPEGVLKELLDNMDEKELEETRKEMFESIVIWHDVSKEVPTNFGCPILVACRNKNMECGIWLYDLIQCWEGEWEPRDNWEKPIKWAYIEYLLK